MAQAAFCVLRTIMRYRTGCNEGDTVIYKFHVVRDTRRNNQNRFFFFYAPITYRDNRHRIRRIFFVIEEPTDEYKFPVNEKACAFVCHERVRRATKHGNKRGRLIPNTYEYCSFGFYRYIYCPLRINMHITEYGVRGVLESKADR